MFIHLPPPARPSGNSRLSAFWLVAAAISLTLSCLVHSGQPYAFTAPLAQHAPPEQLSPHSFIQAIPEIGLISEVRASGPHLRAVATAWPVETMIAARQIPSADDADMPAAGRDSLSFQHTMPDNPPQESEFKAVHVVPDPENAAQ
jgi:hypothetical protein